VRLLFDANLSPEVARRLSGSGHDAIHVVDIGLLSASDPDIMRVAAEEDRVLITADSDFAAMLALGELRGPSVVLLRSADHLRPPDQAILLIANLPRVEDELAAGAIVSLNRRHLRVRELPVDRQS
jgi:predicted nuclease of predicted toxin-antitoxin system